MTSDTGTILAVALPLGVCLIFSLVFGLCYRRRVRSKAQEVAQELQETKERLEKFSTLFSDKGHVEYGTNDHELRASYHKTYHEVNAPIYKYLCKWMPYDPEKPPIPDEVSRLEAVLFPEPDPYELPTVATELDNCRSFNPENTKLPIKRYRNTCRFFNPHQYTSTEMVKILNTPYHGWTIVCHIMVSILLMNTSLEGSCAHSLLPLHCDDVNGLQTVSAAQKSGIRFEHGIKLHISRFAYYKTQKGKNLKWELYHNLFETIFQPYFKSSSSEDVKERRADFEEVLAAAAAHGMLCLSSLGNTEYIWGERLERDQVMCVPAMEIAVWGLTRLPDRYDISTHC